MMKTVTVVLLLFTTAFAFPATSDVDSNESEFFRPLNKKGVPAVEEVDVSDSEEDSFFFPSFFRPILVNPFPKFHFGGFSNLFPSSMFRLGSLFNMFGRVPEDAKVMNSTSTVKVIDGQRVTVNVTTYERDGAIFKYEVVEVVRDRPDREGEGEKNAENEKPLVITSEETTTRKSESDESSSPKNDNNSLDNEIFREEFNRNDWDHDGGCRLKTQPLYSNYNRLQPNHIDLSNDIRVNEIAKMAAINSGVPFRLPQDVEVFHVPRQNIYQTHYEKPRTRHYDSPAYNYQKNSVSSPPYAHNVHYYNIPPRNYFYSQTFLPLNSYNYQWSQKPILAIKN